jgi:V/A-type H+-transporting ATPase subunit I
MITRMDRALVVGPKALMREVVEEVQAQGAVHITEVKEGKRLKVSWARGSTPEEKLLSRVEGVLNLLPGMAEALGMAGEETLESWEAFVQDSEAKAHALTKQRVELEDERGIVEAYAEAVRLLAPLLAPLETSRNFEAIGFTLEKRKAPVLEALRTELLRLTEGRALVFSQEVDPRTLGAVVAFRKSDREKIRSLFVKQGVNELRLPSSVSGMPMADAVRALEGRRRDLPGDIARVQFDLEKLSRDAKPRLSGIALELRDRLARSEVLKSFGETRKTFILTGYVPSKSSPGLKDRLRARFGESLLVKTTACRPSHGHDPEEPPVLLQNHSLVSPFELFIKILQPPKYGTIDPTPYFALFFPIFFGLIMGDIAYGLIILGFGLWMLLKFRSKLMVQQVGKVMIICGSYTILFGFVFGEFFGDFFEHLGWLHPVTLLGIEWNRMTALIPLLVVAVSIGVAHVTLGFVLNFVNALRLRHVHEIIEVPAILLALTGLFTLIAALARAFPAGMVPAVAALVISIPVLLYLKGPLIVIELLSFVGNMLSYARLMAVGVASVYLAFVANMFAGMVGNIVIGVIIAALIHAINLALAFSPIIQSARLHYVEFFGKFYKPGGKEYKPFKRGGITP